MKKEKKRIIGSERPIFFYPEPSKHALDIGVFYPSNYSVGMSNLAFHFLYHNLKREHAFRVHRIFKDTAPFTLEEHRNIKSLKAIFTTISYEEDYLSLAKALSDSGVQLRRERRKGGPLIIAGGPAVTANPSILLEIADVIAVGEGEEVLSSIIGVLSRSGAGPEFLSEASKIASLIVPSVGLGVVQRNINYERKNFSSSVILTPFTAFADAFLIEIARGCPGWCNFCLARGIYGRYRYADLDWIKEQISSLPDGVTVGLVSTAVLSHPSFVEIVDFAVNKGHRVTLSSIRAEDLRKDTVEAISRAGLRSIAIAPEAGSEKVRFALGKIVKNEIYISAVRMLADAGVTSITLYFIAGSPFEDEESLVETDKFLAALRRESRRVRLSIHASVLIPKASTPFQYLELPGRESVLECMRSLQSIAVKNGLNFKAKGFRSAARQAILSLGDERVGRAIILSAVEGVAWGVALRRVGFEDSILYSRKDSATIFPWDRFYGDREKESLYRRFKKVVEKYNG